MSDAFYRIPAGDWSEIDDDLRSEITTLSDAVGQLSPRDAALKMSELANRLFEQLNRDERDIRQVISTLRTAHAVAWDFYDAVQATRVSVDEYMQALRRN